MVCVPRLSSLLDVYEETSRKAYLDLRAEFVVRPCYQDAEAYEDMPCDPDWESYQVERKYDFQETSTKNPLDDRNSTINGPETFNQFLHIVNHELPFKLYSFQKKFFMQILRVVAEYLIGPDWKNVATYYMRLYGWKSVSTIVFGVAPRRFGKTVVVSLVQLALALCLQSRIITLSTGLRASNGMRDIVVKCLEESKYRDRLRSGIKGEELLIETLFQPGRTSSLRFFPANERIVRMCLRFGCRIVYV